MSGVTYCLAGYAVLLINLATPLQSLQVAWCNETVHGAALVSSEDSQGSASITLTFPGQEAEHENSIYCWFRFEGEENQIVKVDVRQFHVGDFDADSKECDDGYLRISDRDVCSSDPDWMPPTTLCGNYSGRVKRYTLGPSAFIEYRSVKDQLSGGYDFDVEFVNLEVEGLPYGNLHRLDGRIANTKCDWLIPVNECDIGYCRAISPLYPGIYAPHTRCQYLFSNFDDGRVELIFRNRGQLKIKPNPNCAEDYMEVYDGASTAATSLGRWCGSIGGEIISSGPTLLLVFRAGPGGPPWDYTGFDLDYTSRWALEHEGGRSVQGTICDWLFDSKLSEDPTTETDLHTPDYYLPNNTKCYFNFTGRPMERVNLEVSTFGAQSIDCDVILDIMDGSQNIGRICPSPKRRRQRPHSHRFNSTGPQLTVIYTTLHGHLSKRDPIWMHYHFWNDSSKRNLYEIDSDRTTRFQPTGKEPHPDVQDKDVTVSKPELVVSDENNAAISLHKISLFLTFFLLMLIPTFIL